MPERLPILPVELEREIFELTARQYRGSAVRLVLVAHRVHIWYVCLGSSLFCILCLTVKYQ